MTDITRGNYGEINTSGLSNEQRTAVNALFEAVKNAKKIDEHGGWEFGAEFDRKGQGSSLNWDLYAVGNDLHNGGFLMVIQIRQFVRQRKNWFANIRKSYFLCGTNEDRTVFAHPVESRVIHAAIKADKDVITAVQSWIFDCDYNKVIRQGDLCLVPMRKTPGGIVVDSQAVLQNSHRLTAREMRQNGNLYALDPDLVHVPGTHPAVSGNGWFKVVVGNRAEAYSFARPTID